MKQRRGKMDSNRYGRRYIDGAGDLVGKRYGKRYRHGLGLIGLIVASVAIDSKEVAFIARVLKMSVEDAYEAIVDTAWWVHYKYGDEVMREPVDRWPYCGGIDADDAQWMIDKVQYLAITCNL